MINTISPLYMVAMICAVALIIVLIAGIILVKRRDDLDEEFDEEWMDFEQWRRTR